MQIRDPKPEISRLEELAISVRLGEIKLPKFQRPFVWKEPDMLNLLDSIYKGYPIGSLLIWNSSQKLISERSISGLPVNTEDNSFFPTNYLLDGQQRLTTLCGALYWEGGDENSKWNIHFDLDNEQFIHPRRRDIVSYFPLNKLINTRDFIGQCMKFEHHDKRDHYYMVAERLLKSIKDYKIAVVKIGDMTIDEVAPIFERINSTGRKLTIVDLMMAATWSNGFDLNSEIRKISDGCKECGFEDISENIILRTIAASAELGINKDDIQKLRGRKSDELTSASRSAHQSLVRALEFLSKNIGIRDYSYIPYAFQLTYLAEFFRIVHEPDDEQIAHLVKWFWYTSVTRYFGTSNTGQVTKDLNAIRMYARRKLDRLFDPKEIDITQLLHDRFNLRNATSTTFALLLNSFDPRSTIDGKPIDGSHLKIKSNKFYASYCPINTSYRNHNISKVIYPYPDKDGDIEANVAEEVLETNLLNNRCVEVEQLGEITNYVNERSRIVAKQVELLTGCSVRFTTTLDTEANTEESEDLDAL
jgi:hypothetical protein